MHGTWPSELIMIVAVALFVTIALVTDMRRRIIPNWLTVSSFGLALAFHLAVGGWQGLVQAMAGFAVGFGILFVLWLIGGGGGGDVKLMGALGAWLGAPAVVIIFLASAVLAVLISVGGSIRFGFKRTATASTAASDSTAAAIDTSSNHRRTIAFAIPVAAATWTWLLLRLFTLGAA